MSHITVIIPTYNRKAFLGKAIESVLSQSHREFSLLIIDDGSTDGTKELVHSYTDSRVSYIYQNNRGVSAARNRGIQETKEEWIAFLDSDDYWLPNKLAKQISFSKTHPHYLIHQTEEIWIRNGKRINPMKKHHQYEGMIYEQCLPLCIISPSSVMIHRSLFETVGLFNESLPACEDYDLWLRISARYPVGLLREKLIVKYGGHQDQLSSSHPALDRFRIEALVSILRSNTLSREQRIATISECKRKCAIYAEGAWKRGNSADAAKYVQISSLFE